MTNPDDLFDRLVRSLYLIILAFFLFGCGSSPGISPANDKTNQPASAAAGNVEQGRNLFMGIAHFQNDGPPCMGCHSVDENGLLGGGALGPNLTNVSRRYTQVELSGILSNTEPDITPVMQPIYTDSPLITQEKADLLAFLDASAGQPESNLELLVIGLSLAGTFAVAVLLGVIYRGRLRGVRKPLIKKAQHKP